MYSCQKGYTFLSIYQMKAQNLFFQTWKKAPQNVNTNFNKVLRRSPNLLWNAQTVITLISYTEIHVSRVFHFKLRLWVSEGIINVIWLEVKACNVIRTVDYGSLWDKCQDLVQVQLFFKSEKKELQLPENIEKWYTQEGKWYNAIWGRPKSFHLFCFQYSQLSSL